MSPRWHLLTQLAQQLEDPLLSPQEKLARWRKGAAILSDDLEACAREPPHPSPRKD